MSETVDHRRLTELRALMRAIEEAGWEYARVEIDGATMVVSSDPNFAAGDAPATRPGPSPAAAPEEAPPAEAAAAQPAAVAQPVAANAPDTAPKSQAIPSDGPLETITSPTIGLFWRSPKPGAPPFVEVGASVAAGDTVCIIEVMKLMTHVAAPVAGIVTAIHMENGSMVEHGTALVDVAPSSDDEVSQ